MMRKFLSFLILTLLIGLASSLLILRRYEAAYPKSLAPVFEKDHRLNHRDYLNAYQPRMVLLGDSTLRDSVDFELLNEQLGFEAYEVAVPGSSSALWYLMMKNNIITAEHKPEYVVIFMRETMLTTPEYRVDGGIFVTIDEYAKEDEPLLVERSYLQQYSRLERAALRWLPLYGDRSQVLGSINYRIRYTLPVLFGCGVGCVDQAYKAIFEGAVDDDAILKEQEAGENYLWRVDKLFFPRQLRRSYLPEMVRMANENDIQLIFVEAKTWRSAPSSTTSVLLNRYKHDLHAYLDENSIKMISFANDPRLPREWFPDGFHIRKELKPEFTSMFSQALLEIVD